MSKTMQDLFNSSRQKWLNAARETARKILKEQPSLTIEDVLERCPKPGYLHRNTIGAVLQHTDFKVVGYTLAKKPSSHKRLIRVWGLK